MASDSGSMKAAVLPHPGGPELFDYTDRPIPALSTFTGQGGEGVAARVKVKSCAVAYRDIIDRTGGFPFMQQPTILGHEFAGVVDSVGNEVDPEVLAVGDRVVSLHWAQDLGWPAPFDTPAMQTFLGLSCDGGYAEFCVSHHSAFGELSVGYYRLFGVGWIHSRWMWAGHGSNGSHS